MAKKKKKTSAKKAPAKKKSSEPCPECGKELPLFWHGRRVLCEPCIEENTHAAERGELTLGGVTTGAMALFRDVWFPVLLLTAGFGVGANLLIHNIDLDASVHIAASFLKELVHLVFLAAAMDVGLTALDGERSTIGESLLVGLKKFFPLFIAVSLQGMIILVHFLLLVVPGVVKAVSYAIVPPLVVSGEAGAISCLHESWRRMHGHRKVIGPAWTIIWLVPFIVLQYVGLVAIMEPTAIENSLVFATIDLFYPLLDVPWLFFALALHARLRKHFRLAAEP